MPTGKIWANAGKREGETCSSCLSRSRDLKGRGASESSWEGQQKPQGPASAVHSYALPRRLSAVRRAFLPHLPASSLTVGAYHRHALPPHSLILPLLSDRSYDRTMLELSWSGPFYPPPPCPVEPPGRRKPLDLSSQSWEVFTCRVLTTLTSGVPSKLTRGPLLLLWKACCLGCPWQRATAITFRGYGGRKLIGETIALLESWWRPCWLVLTPGRIPRPVRDESLGLASSVA